MLLVFAKMPKADSPTCPWCRMDTSRGPHRDTTDCIRALQAEIDRLNTALKHQADRRRLELETRKSKSPVS
jgi:hypothetical protein